MKLSLIIPIYKAEPFLLRLIENLEAQGIFFDDKEIGEVIFINDGSPDNSESIILDYSKKHPWIKYIKQENQGQHIARNTGIKVAQGDYIAFMDQDDAYTNGALSILISIAEKTDADIVRGKALWPIEENFYEWRKHDISKQKIITKYYTGLEYISATKGLCYTTMVWGSVYKKNFLISNNLYFPPDVRYYEDAAFNWNIMPEANKVVVVSNVVYLWIQRDLSDSHDESLSHRITRESNSEYSSIFFKELYDKYKDKPCFPQMILKMMQIQMWWSCYKYLGTMIKLRGLTKKEIDTTIKRIKGIGIYPYPHSFPSELPPGYPHSCIYKVIWSLMSYEWILRIMLNFRYRRHV